MIIILAIIIVQADSFAGTIFASSAERTAHDGGANRTGTGTDTGDWDEIRNRCDSASCATSTATTTTTASTEEKKDRNKEEKKYNTRREIGKTNETVSELLMRVLLLELAGVRLLTEARASPLDLALCRDREHCKKEGSKQKKNQPRKEAMEANEMVMILKKSKNETKRARRVKRKYMSKKCKHNKEIQKGRESKVDEIKRNDWGNQ